MDESHPLKICGSVFCASLVLKWIKRSDINIGRSMLDVRRSICPLVHTLKVSHKKKCATLSQPQGASHHQADILQARIIGFQHPHEFASKHNGNPITQFENFVQVFGDQQDGPAFPAAF